MSEGPRRYLVLVPLPDHSAECAQGLDATSPPDTAGAVKQQGSQTGSARAAHVHRQTVAHVQDGVGWQPQLPDGPLKDATRGLGRTDFARDNDRLEIARQLQDRTRVV